MIDLLDIAQLAPPFAVPDFEDGLGAGNTFTEPYRGLVLLEEVRPLAFQDFARPAAFAEAARPALFPEVSRSPAFTESPRAALFLATRGPNVQTLIKRPAESRVYSFDFSQLPEIVAGDTLTTPVTATNATGGTLVVGTPAVSGDTVQVTVSGGDDGVFYSLQATATTSAGAVLACVGRLRVTQFGS